MSSKNLDYLNELSIIENKVKEYENTAKYYKNVESRLEKFHMMDFDQEIDEIKNYLSDLSSIDKVIELVKIFNSNVKKFKIKSEALNKEFQQIPIELVGEKKEEINNLLLSPKTINQAEEWINKTKNEVDSRNRSCFPKELSQYKNPYLIGNGGFARVYKVEKLDTNSIVAVKIPLKKDSQIGKSFLRELNNWVELKHKNIVEVYDYNILPTPYIEMEWCDFCLDDIKKPMDVNDALVYIQGISEGLRHAHKKHIVHLDLKPQNILLKDDIPKISDWGLSKLTTKQGTTTLGISLPFAAPEQFSIKYGKKDFQTDIWQIGILLYNLLTDSIPFSGSDIVEYGKNITTKNIRPLIKKDSKLKVVSHIMLKCLARNKKDRYQNVEFLLKDVKEMI